MNPGARVNFVAAGTLAPALLGRLSLGRREAGSVGGAYTSEAMKPKTLDPKNPTVAPRGSPLRVMIVDDSYLIREGLTQLLALAPQLAVVGRFDEAQAMLERVANDPPDVVVLDIRLPPSFTDEGLRAAEVLRARHPDVGVVVLSQHGSAHSAARVLAGGSLGRGYLLKDRIHDLDHLVSTIEGVAAGECRIDPQLVDGLLVHRARPRAPLEALTPRQREILAVVAAGRSNLAIARHFGVTQRAVEKHVNEIFGRLGIANDESISRRVHATLLFLAEDDAP